MEKTSITPMTLRQTMEREGCEIFHYDNRELGTVPLHHHDFYEVYYVLRGETDYIVEGGRYHLSPGSLLLIAPHELHRPDARGAGKVERVVLWVGMKRMLFISEQMPGIKRLLEDHRNRGSMLTVREDMRGRLYALFETLSREQREGGEHSELMSKAVLLQLFICFKRMALSGGGTLMRARLPGVGSGAPLSEVFDYIQKNISLPLNAGSLSERFFYSPSTLTRYFKKYTGVTVSEYIRKKRLAVARDRMMDGCTAAEASRQCGFKHYSTFYRAYVKEYGECPVR